MSDNAEDDRVELAEPLDEVTEAQADADPSLRSDPSKALEGVAGDPDLEADPDFQDAELEAIEELLDDDEGKGIAAPISKHQKAALKLAVTQKGNRETPPDSNKNRYSTYFGFGAQFWCADFVAWALDRTGNRDRKVPWGYPSAVKNITAWGQQHGKIHSQPRAGDIFTKKDGSHTGFVLSANGSAFMSIEGNTGGSFVKSLSRTAADGSYFFVRHDWDDPAA